MNPILIYFFLLSSSFAFAQAYQNPSEKYLDAYKKYEDAACPVTSGSISNFVYFSRDRAAIIDHPFLTHPAFNGAQIMYTWKELEPGKDEYDFSKIEEDMQYLHAFGKKLFIQLQDVTFNTQYKAVPNYLMNREYEGGVTLQYDDDGNPEGWVAKRWNAQVRVRFAALLRSLGERFGGKIEGINLQETSIGVSHTSDSSFTEAKYLNGLKANMSALKMAFPTSKSMIYANFIPGEWLPWEDKGYLRSIYTHGEKIGVGLGAPDLMVTRKGQLNSPLAMMHEGNYTVPIGIAVQDGNYVGKTGADADYDEYSDKGTTSRTNIVPMLHAFALDFLKVRYIFWVNQQPYFEEDVLPCFAAEDEH